MSFFFHRKGLQASFEKNPCGQAGPANASGLFLKTNALATWVAKAFVLKTCPEAFAEPGLAKPFVLKTSLEIFPVRDFERFWVLPPPPL